MKFVYRLPTIIIITILLFFIAAIKELLILIYKRNISITKKLKLNSLAIIQQQQ